MESSNFSAKNYFQQTDCKEKNFFDDIEDNDTKPLRSGTTQDLNLLQKVTEAFGLPNHSAKDRFNMNSVSPEESVPKPLVDKPEVGLKKLEEIEGLVQSVEEPVICRIFSSQNSEPSLPQQTISRPSSFFDMLGSHIAWDPSNGFLKFPPNDYIKSMGAGLESSQNNNFGIDELPDVDDFFGLNYRTSKDSPVCERHRDAWIPSERTRRVLITVATTSSSGSAGGYLTEKVLLTMPGVSPEEEMTDNVGQLVAHTMGAGVASRNSLTANDVTQDERGLRTLIEREDYRAAVNLTARLLTIYGQGVGKKDMPSKHTVHSIQLWFTRLALLVKLREAVVADTEADMWWDCDRPDLYYQFYPELYGGRLGTMIPFQMRLLLATIPAHCNKHKQALDRLFSVLGVIRQILRNLDSGRSEDGSQLELTAVDRTNSKKLWQARENRVLVCVINIALETKDYCLASEVITGMIHKVNGSQSLMRKYLYSTLGRINLQLGDVFAAEGYFLRAKAAHPKRKGSMDFQDIVDKGLLAVAQNNFQEAYELFKKALLMRPNDITIVNNCAVCLLYLGNLKEAIKELATIVEVCPAEALQDHLVLNLCTLYELESSSHSQKKIELLKRICEFKGDAINISSLKLT